jgi:hypothetical protein
MTFGRITRIAFLVFSAVLLSAFIASSGGRPAAAEQVPFKGTLFLLAVPDYSDTSCPGALRLNVSEVGHVTQMGAVTAKAFVCQILDPNDLTFTGQFTYTAANGDTVSGTFFGKLVPVSGTLYQLQGEQFTITGGTGRFANASGGGMVTGSVDLASGQGVQQLDGSISSVGSGN